ncbi:MAG: hypothetical protein J0I06_13825, partial [Planctomycetes bacterium]|nr:hypothetical protein [Planctomycetota bacterium]
PPVPLLAPVLAAMPRAVQAHKRVTISGRVTFPKDAKLPKPKLVPADLIKDAELWKPFGPLTYNDTVINPDSRGIADVIVFLRPDSDDRKAEFPADRIHPDLAGAKSVDHTVTVAGPHFAPRILAARAGDRLVFQNRLPTPIAVGYISHGNGPNAVGNRVLFNVMIAQNAAYTSDPLPAMQRVDSFQNSSQPWMHGFVWALDHPYFAVTDADGRFEMPNVPVGTWRLVAWHQVAGWSATGRLGKKLTVPGTRRTHELAPLTFASGVWPE